MKLNNKSGIYILKIGQLASWSLAVLTLVTIRAGETLNFNPAWQFIKADPHGAEKPSFNDESWATISAPHTYNDIDTFDNWSPAGHKGEMDQWGGRTWYRKKFVALKSWRGKKVFIEFEAVRQVAEIYLNGTKLGKSENGFLPFAFDLTPHLKIGESNILAVMCDNSFIKDESGRHKWGHFEGGAKLPWNNPHWHPAHGGIYRNVYLHIKDPLHLTLPIYSNLKTVGTYAYASEISRKSAQLTVEPQIRNLRSKVEIVTVSFTLLDNAGKVILEKDISCQLKPGTTITPKLTGTVTSPHLWEPGYPYMYSIKVSISQQGKTIDSTITPFGFRTTHFNRATGFFINNRYIKLHGWGQKSTDEWPGLGAAMPDWMHDYTLKLMYNAGGNFVRWGHTAGAPVHIRSSDKYGIITIQPGVDGESDIKGHPWTVRSSAFRDMIIYYRNHPSIIIWEGGNQSTSEEHTKELKAIVAKYDPHGGRAYAHRRCNSTVEKYCDITISTEGSGYRKALPTVEGEYNREESPRRVWDTSSPPDFSYKNAKGTYKLTSEQFAINQIFQYNKIAPRAHCGGANWIFTDSTSGGRVQSEVARASGEIDAVRLPKEAYHVCKVLFTDKPDLHIIGHWTYPAGTIKSIYVAADCDEVELIINGQSKGRKRAFTGKSNNKKFQHKNIFSFSNINWYPGTIKAIGYINGKSVAEQQKKTAGPPVSLKITAITGPDGFLATGSDVALFDIEAVDAKGCRCPTFQQRCDFTVEGPAVWRGGYNSGKINSTNNKYLDLECGINRVAVRSMLKPGTVILKVISKGLKSAIIHVTSKAIIISNGTTTILPAIAKQTLLIPLRAPSGIDLKELTAGSKQAKENSTFFANVSYSGPFGKVKVVKTLKGKQLFIDHKQKLTSIPEILQGGEFIQIPNTDWNYSAVDLLQFECRCNATITIAHDDRLKKMEWLSSHYKDTGQKLKLGKHTWSLFSRIVKKGDSILIGSNTEITGSKRWMMIIFATPEKSSKNK